MRTIHREIVGSTNDTARELLATGETTPFWVRADAQTAGRGRLSRDWVSKPGNLFCTGVIDTKLPPCERHRIGFAASLGVRDTLAAAGIADAELKWPNDVLIDRHKVAGMLLETEGDHVLIGIGLNIAHHPDGTRTLATHTAEHGWSPTPAEALERVAHAVAERVSQGWTRVHRDWVVHSCSIGEEFAVDQNGRRLVGTHAGIGANGELLLRTPSGTVPIMSGDMIPSARPR